jgi:hypothetical protein
MKDLETKYLVKEDKEEIIEAIEQCTQDLLTLMDKRFRQLIIILTLYTIICVCIFRFL